LTISFSQFQKSPLAAQRLGHGILPSTLVETPEGWRKAGSLTAGDRLVTRSSGPLVLVAVEQSFRPGIAAWAMHIPVLALDNPTPQNLMPGQRVLIEGAAALPHCGATRALVPALALEGWRGVEPLVPLFPEAPVLLRLSAPELVHAGPGMWLACEGSLLDPVARHADALPEPGLDAARQLVAALMCAEAAA
jgi:hypothetical protein